MLRNECHVSIEAVREEHVGLDGAQDNNEKHKGFTISVNLSQGQSNINVLSNTISDRELLRPSK